MTPVTVVLADHRDLFRGSMTDLLRAEGLTIAAATADVGATALQVQRTSPDVVLVVGSMPSALGRLVPQLRAQEPRPRILVLDHATGAEDQGRLLAAIEAGADGYTTGRGGLTGLADAVRTLAAGGTVVPPDLLGPLLRGLIDRRREASVAFENLIALTPREREILLLVGEGLDHDGIADRLVISSETARTHVHRVLRKLGVGSRLEAVSLVRRHGLAEHLERIVERTAS